MADIKENLKILRTKRSIWFNSQVQLVDQRFQPALLKNTNLNNNITQNKTKYSHGSFSVMLNVWVLSCATVETLQTFTLNDISL